MALGLTRTGPSNKGRRDPLDHCVVLLVEQAVLKIIKHCTESLPQMVAGSLLGLDQTGILEVRGHETPIRCGGGSSRCTLHATPWHAEALIATRQTTTKYFPFFYCGEAWGGHHFFLKIMVPPLLITDGTRCARG